MGGGRMSAAPPGMPSSSPCRPCHPRPPPPPCSACASRRAPSNRHREALMHPLPQAALRIASLVLFAALRLLTPAQDTPEVLPPLIYVPYDHLPDAVLSSSVLMPYEHYLQSWK